jgi:hypothetical protein
MTGKTFIIIGALATPLLFSAILQIRAPAPHEERAGGLIEETLRNQATEGTASMETKPARRVDQKLSASAALASVASANGNEMPSSAVENIALAEVPERLNALLRQPKDGWPMPGEGLLARWTRANPQAAFDWAQNVTLTNRELSVLERVSAQWAEADLRAAARAVEQMTAGDARDSAAKSVAYEAAREDTLVALKLAVTLPPDSARNDLLEFVISQWAGRDGPAATAWANGISDPSLKSRLVAAAAMVRAGQDGQSAAASVATDLPPGIEQDRAALVVARHWGKASDAAAAWVAQFPPGELRDAARESFSSK